MLAVDRSAKAIEQASKASDLLVVDLRMSFLQCRVEDLILPQGMEPFDLAFAFRVGALDGRYPDLEVRARASIRKALVSKGRLFIDGGSPLKEIRL